MPSKKTRYTRLETESESPDSDDEAPPAQVQLHASQCVRASRWNHVENLDVFFNRVYQYQQQHGLWAIALSDSLELVQFAFMVLFSAFLLTCLRYEYLFSNPVNDTKVELVDVVDISKLSSISPMLVMILLMAFVFWIHRLCKSVWRFIKFWEIRSFFTEVLNIAPSELRNYGWLDVLAKLKEAQKDYKMNIRKQELTELDVYHRMLRFKNYLVAMVNKEVLPCKIWIPFYGEKVFFTHGLKYNYELLLFWGPGAPFRNNFYLHNEYKSASRKHELISKLRFRVSILALVNLCFSPFILLYQILYSFFSYAELLKRQPGVFGRRRWSLYGRLFLRHFNELDHEILNRLNKAYIPAVKYMDLFVLPIATILARNVAFIAGSLFAVLAVLTVLQEDLLTAHNVLTIITMLGVLVTICRVFIPDEHQHLDPSQLMAEILSEIHYMPDHWKERPHTVQVYGEFTQVFQFTVLYLIDEMLSPLITPFVLYFKLRNKSGEIIDFLRNFTIDVSGVGDVCSFAEMDVKKHGNPDWQVSPLTRAGRQEQADLGKTEMSLMQFSHNNPNWEPGEDANCFMSQIKESAMVMWLTAEEMYQSMEKSFSHSLPTNLYEVQASNQARLSPGHSRPMLRSQDSMSLSMWASAVTDSMVPVLHMVHDSAQQDRKAASGTATAIDLTPGSQRTRQQGTQLLTVHDPYPASDSSLSSSDLRVETQPSDSTPSSHRAMLREPLISSDEVPPLDAWPGVQQQ